MSPYPKMPARPVKQERSALVRITESDAERLRDMAGLFGGKYQATIERILTEFAEGLTRG